MLTSNTLIQPDRHQPKLERSRFILNQPPGDAAEQMDVLFVGAGPAGLAGAIELARLVNAGNEAGDGVGDIQIAVLEKAAELGEHNLSGAVINPRSFHELFPKLPETDFPFRRPVSKEAVYLLRERHALRIPTPPPMRNHGNQIASICEVVRWLGAKAEEAGVHILTGFPADGLLTDGDAVTGVRTTPSGLDRDGNPGSGHMPAVDLQARVTVLAEGSRGPLTQAYLDWQEVNVANPQIYSLGVKELWEVTRPLDRIIHTMGWPLPGDAFGGSFAYPLADNLVALGLVVSLDYKDARLDIHGLLQRLKHHPFFYKTLNGGEMVEWGAKTIPEGGYHALPSKRHGAGVCIVGDAAGYVDVLSLKGIHYAMHSGILAARTIYEALKNNDLTETGLAPYTKTVDESFITRDLHRSRNIRLGFKKGFLSGGIRAAIETVTRGRLPGGLLASSPDAAEAKSLAIGVPENQGSGGPLAVTKLDAVYRSGNQTRDDIPSHLTVSADVPREVAEMYVHLCPAGVYELDGENLVVNAPNCVDCKATDVLGPRWAPREGGSGPRYRRM